MISARNELNIFDKLITFVDVSVKDALEIIEKGAHGILYYADAENCLLGSLSDGDIRRWLIDGGDLKTTISKLMHKNPVFVYKNNIINADDIMRTYTLNSIPVLDDDNHIVDIVIFGDNNNAADTHKNVLKNIPIVIMAGGKGTRLYPYTKILPKPLIPIGDTPIVEHIISQFTAFGACNFSLIVNHKKNMIKAYFGEYNDLPYRLSFVDEDLPLGTGGGLSLIKNQIDTTFILSNCDILVLDDFEEIIKQHYNDHNAITVVCSLKTYTIPYGTITVGKNGKIDRMEEKPVVSYMTNTGCYVVEKEVLDIIPDNTFIGFPEIIEKCMSLGMKIGIFPISENSWLDMGQLEGMEDMRKRLERNKNINS